VPVAAPLDEEIKMNIEETKALLAPLTPEGRHWVAGDDGLDLVIGDDDDNPTVGLGIVTDDEKPGAYLLASVLLFAEIFDAEEVDEKMVLERAATALGLPEGLDCEVGIEVYSGRDDDGALIQVEEEGELEVDAFEVCFSPDADISSLDPKLLTRLIADAPFILPSEA
jgi:hypothetical protein